MPPSNSACTMTSKTSAESPHKRWRLMIVDDHPIVRQGLVQMLNQEPDLTICWEGGSPDKALAAVPKANPNLIIIDLGLPGASGLELIKNLKASYPVLPALVLSMHDEALYAARVLRAGGR